MTSDLEQIAEEIEGTDLATVRIVDHRAWVARIRAWIAANKESPQRKAFVEKAEHACHVRHEWLMGRADWHAVKLALADQTAALDAAVEAEKVEAERGEGTK